MGNTAICADCGKEYATQEDLEVLRENESVCLRCGGLVKVDNWDVLLASWQEEPEERDLELDLFEIDQD